MLDKHTRNGHNGQLPTGDVYSQMAATPCADHGRANCQTCSAFMGPEVPEDDCPIGGLPTGKGPVPDEAKESHGKSASALLDYLWTLGIDYRWNVRQGSLQYHEAEGEWTPETDRHSADVRERISSTFKVKFGRDTFADRVNVLAYRAEVDPAMDWLDSLPDHDGVARIDGLLHSCFVLTDRADPPELVAWVSRFLTMGAVWRTLNPGTKLDETPVLVGPQGVGKSTALQYLLPPDEHDWFADGLNCLSTDREFAETLAGRVIVELSEMRGRSIADIDALKSRLTRTNDGYHRGAYARHAERQLRRAIIVGTTNSMAALPNDATGNRRFVAVNITAGAPADVRRYLDANRDQLWAEALARCRAGENPRLPDDFKDIQADNNERYRSADELLEVALDGWLSQLTDDHFALTACAQAMRDIIRVDTKRLTAALIQAGWQSCLKRVDGKPKRVWTRA